MRTCRACGKTIELEAAPFCPHCGRSVEASLPYSDQRREPVRGGSLVGPILTLSAIVSALAAFFCLIAASVHLFAARLLEALLESAASIVLLGLTIVFVHVRKLTSQG